MQPAPGHLVSKSLCTFTDAWAVSKMPLMGSILVRQFSNLIVVASDVLVRKPFQTHINFLNHKIKFNPRKLVETSPRLKPLASVSSAQSWNLTLGME